MESERLASRRLASAASGKSGGGLLQMASKKRCDMSSCWAMLGAGMAPPMAYIIACQRLLISSCKKTMSVMYIYRENGVCHMGKNGV